MKDNDLLAGWAMYVMDLSSSADESTRSEDRQQYTRHLAAAAVIGAKLVAREYAAARAVLESERRAYGWSYLSDAPGDRAEKAFAKFERLLSDNHE